MMSRERKKPSAAEGQQALTPEQDQAIELFVAGLTIDEVSRVMARPRPTIYAWLRWHPQFLTELYRRQDDRLKRLMREEVRDVIQQAARRANLGSQDLKTVDRVLDDFVAGPD
jgi:hypothetical protein